MQVALPLTRGYIRKRHTDREIGWRNLHAHLSLSTAYRRKTAARTTIQQSATANSERCRIRCNGTVTLYTRVQPSAIGESVVCRGCAPLRGIRNTVKYTRQPGPYTPWITNRIQSKFYAPKCPMRYLSWQQWSSPGTAMAMVKCAAAKS